VEARDLLAVAVEARGEAVLGSVGALDRLVEGIHLAHEDEGDELLVAPKRVVVRRGAHRGRHEKAACEVARIQHLPPARTSPCFRNISTHLR
jgi:hypothetical protein